MKMVLRSAPVFCFKVHIYFGLLLALCVPAFGQQTGFSGVITDAQGGVIQGARVEVKETGERRSLRRRTLAAPTLFPALRRRSTP